MRSRRCWSSAERTFWRRTLGIRLGAVETVGDDFAHERRFCWVGCLDRVFGQRRQFLAGQLPLGFRPVSKTDGPRLFAGRELFDLLDNLFRRHGDSPPRAEMAFNDFEARMREKTFFKLMAVGFGRGGIGSSNVMRLPSLRAS